MIASEWDKHEIIGIIEEETGKKIPFEPDSILSKEDQNTYLEFMKLDQKKRIAQKKRIELLSDLFSSDALFEGFCLSFSESDDMLEILCGDYGCAERYNQLRENPVFRKRKGYMEKMSRYALAAVNLYGVVHIGEFVEYIIKVYERLSAKTEGYSRDTGSYRNSLIFSPKWICPFTVHHLVGNCIPEICSSLDGFILHQCFREEVIEDQKEFVKYFSTPGNPVGEAGLEEFYDAGLDKVYFRNLHDMALDHPLYLPAKNEFLRYAREGYYEESLAEKELKKYIRRNY